MMYIIIMHDVYYHTDTLKLTLTPRLTPPHRRYLTRRHDGGGGGHVIWSKSLKYVINLGSNISSAKTLSLFFHLYRLSSVFNYLVDGHSKVSN
jgi:hypothetical protein